MRAVLTCFVFASMAVRAASGLADDARPEPVHVRAHATRRTGPIAIDGRLDEGAWTRAPRQTGFIQRFPKDGARASLETAFAILYDDDAIYVGVWADDPEPQKIRALLTRRDVDAIADAVVIGFDSYHDRRTAYAFQLNAAGVQRDMLLFDDANQDDTWDAVWTGDAAIGAHGWTAEFRVPLDQLRFAAGADQEWGFQLLRVVGRSEEQSTWSPWPRSAPEVVSKFGELDGLDVTPGRRLELLPYASGGVAVQPIEAGDPLHPHVGSRGGVGLDLKYGLGPAFTLSATINPDFGQVEADPSQVNLGPNELFFAEKRPFFLEGVDLFKLPIGNGDNRTEGAFYSRRIGAAPDEPDLDYEYLNAPTSSTIYGAAKLTGKTRSSWSVGVLDAVTGEETAEVIDAMGGRVDPIVAPLTNYAVGRIKRDFRDGHTSVGASATAVDRALAGTPLIGTLHDHAYTAGLQLQHRWADNAWEANLDTVGSWVHGSADAIAITQQLNRHLFQRPDATDVRFDPQRTSLAGLGATWKVGRIGDTKHWRYMIGGDLRTPGLELNDVGFQTTSDTTTPFVWGQYRDDAPGDDILNWQVNADVFTMSNFEPVLENYGFESNISTELASYWSFVFGVNGLAGGVDPVALRGGPALRVDPAVTAFGEISTDSRKRVRFDVNFNGSRNWTQDAISGGIDVAATIQARSNIDLTIGPSWYERDDPMQYVAQVDDTSGGRHYITAKIHQTTTSMTLRVNWTFSPHLSLQAYAQPFIAAGRYSDFKDVENPHADRFSARFHLLGARELRATDGTLFVNHRGSYQLDQPDFDLQQLRSTVVLRWEYRPGSTLFAIWSHGRTHEASDGRFELGRDLSGLASASGDNVVMVKANYWIGL
jgi:Domain of unknown function (DUF5916)